MTSPSYTPIEKGPPEPPLHPEQQKVVDCIVQGKNVFYTGSAGVGKSTVLTAFVRELKNLGKKVDIVAPSGIAALNVGGTTIYSYASWHPDSFKEPLDKLMERAFNKNTYKRLTQTDVLVIDEISMVEADILRRLNVIMCHVRYNSRPFGGAQIVVTGDFCQLPPVKPFRFCVVCGGDELQGYHAGDGRPLRCLLCSSTFEDKDKWAFRADVWEPCNFTYFELRHIHRQNDVRFINILQRCRFGTPLLPEDVDLLLTTKPDPNGAVKLLPRKLEVEAENRRNFESLRVPQWNFECLDHFDFRSPTEPELKKKGLPKYHNRPDGPLAALKDHRLEEKVQLKQGMLVILLVNLDFQAGLVNGSQGRIIGFENHDPMKVFAPPPTAGSLSHKSGRKGMEVSGASTRC